MIRVQPMEGVWQILGQDIFPGAYPQDVVPTWGPAGPESLGFSISRRTSRVHADLLPYTPVEWYPGPDATGAPLWAGYTQQAPPGGTGESTSVTCVGWHYYREDWPRPALWVHDDIAAWQDIRSWRNAYLPQFTTSGQATVGGGAAVIAWPNETTLIVGTAVGIYMDFGPDQECWPAYISVDYEWLGASANASLYVRCADLPEHLTTGGGGVLTTTMDNVVGTPITGAASGSATVSGAVATRRRYVGIFLNRDAVAGAVTAADYGVRVKAARAFRDSAYQTAGASSLTADVVIKSTRARYTPLLSADESQIATVALALRSLAFVTEDTTKRQIDETVNAYHGYRLGVDAQMRQFFQPQPSAPRLQVDAADPRVDYVPTSTNDGTEVYDHVSVRGQSGSGEPLRVDHDLADFADATRNVLARRGRTRSFTRNVSDPTDTTAMDGIAEVFLLSHRTVPHKANLTVQGAVVTDLQAGQQISADHLGRYYGEMIRVLSVPDPDTGALQSRDGIIASIQGSDPCSVAIDTERRSLEALMTRMGVVRG